MKTLNEIIGVETTEETNAVENTDTTQIENEQEVSTENTETENIAETENVAEAENIVEVTETIQQDVLVKEELNDDKIVDYLKNKGYNISSLEEINNNNFNNDLLDEEDKKYYAFKQKTGRTREEFNFVNRNINEISDLEFARQKIRKETGLELSDNDIDNYLEKKLGIDLSFEDLDIEDKIELSKFVKSEKEDHIRLQNEYSQPTTKNAYNPKVNKQNLIKLSDGRLVTSEDYEQMQVQYNDYLKSNKEAVDSITETSFKVRLDIGGVPFEKHYNYMFTNEDKQRMLSETNDTNKIMQKYITEKGFDHKGFNISNFMSNEETSSKVFNAIYQQLANDIVDMVLKDRGNFNFTKGTSVVSPSVDGVKQVPLSDFFK